MRRERFQTPKDKLPNGNNRDTDYYKTRCKRHRLNEIENGTSTSNKEFVSCKICNVNTTNNAGLGNHVRAQHGIQKLDDYYHLNDRDIKAKQNKMFVNDKQILNGISPTHKSKNIKYKYKCIICDHIGKELYCVGHLGLHSHLRAHVNNATLKHNKLPDLYKQIMKQKVLIKKNISSNYSNNNNNKLKKKKRKNIPKKENSNMYLRSKSNMYRTRKASCFDTDWTYFTRWRKNVAPIGYKEQQQMDTLNELNKLTPIDLINN